MKPYSLPILRLFAILFCLSTYFACSSNKNEEKKQTQKVKKQETQKEEDTIRVDLREEKVANLFSIGLVTYLDKVDNLNGDALLQYANSDRDVYIIVIADAKSELDQDYTMDTHFNYATNNIIKGFREPKPSEPVRERINDLYTYGRYITGIVNEENYIYYLQIVESKTHFYQILAWTQSKRIDAQREIKAMIRSFKQL
ncbi:MAG: hypothetical protein EAZ55_03060 [Cytophagales bacterium]|nr:MAG: hypothetical protein EAZ55_03060 [Cytophagales bacterium]